MPLTTDWFTFSLLVAQSGILPSRGSLMLDVVFLATFAIVLVMWISIFLVRRNKMHRVHSRIQITLCIVLLVAITAFEIDLRFFTDWRALARPSPYYDSGWVDKWLWIHLFFSVPTPIIWLLTTVLAVRWFGWEAIPNRKSTAHRRLGWLAAVTMTMTTVTGWIFYYVAFAAI